MQGTPPGGDNVEKLQKEIQMLRFQVAEKDLQIEQLVRRCFFSHGLLQAAINSLPYSFKTFYISLIPAGLPDVSMYNKACNMETILIAILFPFTLIAVVQDLMEIKDWIKKTKNISQYLFMLIDHQSHHFRSQPSFSDW